MRRLVDRVLTRPGPVLAVALLASLLLWPITSRLRLDTDIVDLFPMGNAEAQAFARFSRAFTSEQALLVLATGDDPTQLIRFADDFAARITARPDVAEVRYKLTSGAGQFLRAHLLSLLTDDELTRLAARTEPGPLAERVHRMRSILQAPGGSAMAAQLVADPLEALSIAQERLSSGLPVNPHSGYFQSADGHAVLIYVRPRASAFDVAADRRLVDGAAAVAGALGARVTSDFKGGGLQVGFTGVCAFTISYRDWLHVDMQRSTIFSALSILILFFIFFRSLIILPLVAFPLGLGLWWTATVAALAFGRINAVSLAFGTILLSIGVDLPIQLYNRLREELVRTPEAPRVALATTLRDLAGPSVMATIGPAVVFFSCVASSYRGLAELGFLAGVGLLLNLVAMLTVFPALLAVLPERWWGRVSTAPAKGRITALIGTLAARRPRALLCAVAVVGLIAIPVAAHLQVERRLISIQPPAMPPAQVQRELEQRFGGHERLLIALSEDSDPERALERSDAWLDEAEKLRKAGLLSSYESVSALFPSQKTGQRRRTQLINNGEVMADRLSAALTDAGFDLDPFTPFLSQLRNPPLPPALGAPGTADLDFLVSAHVHDDPSGRRIATFLYPAPGDAGVAAVKKLRQFARRQGDVVTGAPILEEVLADIVAHDTRTLSLLSTACVALLLALYYRRWRPFLAVMGPLVLAWLLFAAALAVIHLPLNLFNLLCVPLVIGYGIDDHVYLVHRHRQDPSGGPAQTLRTTGRAIVLTSLSTMAGFGALIAARFDGLRSLGSAGALAVGFCLIAAFAILPALLALLWPAKAPSA